MLRLIALTFLLLYLHPTIAADLSRAEASKHFVRCSFYFLALSAATEERSNRALDALDSFLFQGMKYQGYAIILMDSAFVDAEIAEVRKRLGSPSVDAAAVAAVLKNDQPPCHELEAQYAGVLADLTKEMNNRGNSR